jgi:ADP-heptose:LPS heptosyltransferase
MIYTPKNRLLAVGLQAAELCLFVFDWVYFRVAEFFALRPANKILIVRLDAIGDFVIWLSAAKALRQMYAGSHVTLLGNDLWTDLAKQLPWFDAVWPLNRKKFLMNPLYRLKMLVKIHRGGFQTVIHTAYNRDFFVGDASVRASRAHKRIGFAGSTENIKPWHKRFSDTWYTTLITSGQKHQLDQDADFVRGLGAEYEVSLPVLPRFPLSKDFPLRDYYVIVPGAGHEMRQWPIERFQEIARRIYNKTGLTGVLCGGKREVNSSRAFSRNLNAPFMDMVGRTALLDLTSIVAHARFIVGNDTGAIHIAVATSTPSLCVLGGAHPGRYIPYPPQLNASVTAVVHPMDCFNCDWHCSQSVSGTVPCINIITVDEVWEALSESILKT